MQVLGCLGADASSRHSGKPLALSSQESHAKPRLSSRDAEQCSRNNGIFAAGCNIDGSSWAIPSLYRSAPCDHQKTLDRPAVGRCSEDARLNVAYAEPGLCEEATQLAFGIAAEIVTGWLEISKRALSPDEIDQRHSLRGQLRRNVAEGGAAVGVKMLESAGGYDRIEQRVGLPMVDICFHETNRVGSELLDEFADAEFRQDNTDERVPGAALDRGPQQSAITWSDFEDVVPAGEVTVEAISIPEGVARHIRGRVGIRGGGGRPGMSVCR